MSPNTKSANKLRTTQKEKGWRDNVSFNEGAVVLYSHCLNLQVSNRDFKWFDFPFVLLLNTSHNRCMKYIILLEK